MRKGGRNPIPSGVAAGGRLTRAGRDYTVTGAGGYGVNIGVPTVDSLLANRWAPAQRPCPRATHARAAEHSPGLSAG